MMRTLCVVLAVLFGAAPALAQSSATPKLDKSQRELLQTIVAAVESASSAPETPSGEWQAHVLRTSDGAHYVAFTIAPATGDAPPPRSMVYVRLATRPDATGATLAERSAVMEWLKGMRSDPLVAQQQRGVAFGEMPTFGAAAVASRGIGQQAADLKVLAMQQERERQRRETEEQERKASLEGTGTRGRNALFPFEDFSPALAAGAAPGGAAPLLRRSLTAGPGDYDLYVAWAAPASRGQQPAVQVKKHRLQLPPASMTELAVSSVIVADSLTSRETPVPHHQQTAYPYALGSMEIVPAREVTFNSDERLTIVFQVMNARGSTIGKPDVAIGFQLFKVVSGGEQSLGLLNPQFYNASTLPADFDVNKGHPLFVAMAAPLKTLGHGDYRLMIEATDKLAQRTVRTGTSFRVIATPQSLLATAPAALPFRREDVLRPNVLEYTASRLRPVQPSTALATALDATRDARFMELLRDDAIDEAERSARATLKGVGLYALGDARIACTTLQQSIDATREAPTLLFLGACRALERNDRDAVAAWTDALNRDAPLEIVVPLLVDAHVRLGDPARAVQLAERLVTSGVPAPAVVAGLATALNAEGRTDDAIALLTPHLAAHADDQDAAYALLHALFAGFVRGQGIGSTREGQERLQAAARAYVDSKGRHAAVVTEWVGVVGPSVK